MQINLCAGRQFRHGIIDRVRAADEYRILQIDPAKCAGDAGLVISDRRIEHVSAARAVLEYDTGRVVSGDDVH